MPKINSRSLKPLKTERCDGCHKRFPRGTLRRDDKDASLLYCRSCPPMNPQFERYIEHVGHKIVVAFYGPKGNKEDAWNVAIECETCGCVLTDEDRHKEER